MTNFEPEQILKKLREWSDKMYWDEDRNIDNSGSTSTSYYSEQRKRNNKEEQERLQIIDQIESMLDR